uniref:ATP synthase subunit a n=1 Tax=Acrochordus granulatus TaxID=46287 RepID=Q402M6_ACRGR|nr:ATP synthase F0 subunit 6 [Acrochordus granulatus]BAE20019.1 ATPase subunit 6 [Acrochordus granulatus]
MNMNMFNQFICPEILTLPITPVLLIITLLITNNKPKLLSNRMTTAMKFMLKNLSINMANQLSKQGQKWLHLLMSLLITIMLSNLIGLLPYTFTTTSQLYINMTLALPMWMATVITGLLNKPSHTLAHMLPETSPTPLIPFMIMIETVSLLMRPLALGVRLTANITAGHLLMTMISSTALIFLNNMITLHMMTMILLMLLTILEMAVACIQAYVFTLLVILYLQENT